MSGFECIIGGKINERLSSKIKLYSITNILAMKKMLKALTPVVNLNKSQHPHLNIVI